LARLKAENKEERRIDKVKALSIKQPWANLIIDNLLIFRKDIEIRTWNTKHRGIFFIHASLKPDELAIKHFGYEDKILSKGCLVGVANLVDVKQYNNKTEFQADTKRHKNFWDPEKYPQYGFILEDVRALDNPIPFKGNLNFFETRMESHLEIPECYGEFNCLPKCPVAKGCKREHEKEIA
jgi:hypothetical protein